MELNDRQLDPPAPQVQQSLNPRKMYGDRECTVRTEAIHALRMHEPVGKRAASQGLSKFPLGDRVSIVVSQAVLTAR